MKELNTYIVEKLKIDKDTKINNKNNQIDKLSGLIKDYFQNKLKYKNTEYLYSFRNKNGEITSDFEKIRYIHITLSSINNGANISSDLTKLIYDEFKEVREVSSGDWDYKNKSISIYFK